jgi:hypothetical protein
MALNRTACRDLQSPGRLRFLTLVCVSMCLPWLLFLISPAHANRTTINFGPLILMQAPEVLRYIFGAAWLALTLWLVSSWPEKGRPTLA